MSTQDRLEVNIDIFEKTNQRALAMPELTPPQLVEAILQEFRELEYLSKSPSDYQLLKAKDRSPLDNASPIQKQLGPKERLILVEQEQPLPAEGKRPQDNLYLHELLTGEVYKLNWLPAIIGRHSPNQPYNDLVAVNLEEHAAGLRVSRRHVVIGHEKGAYYVQNMSNNPASIIRDKRDNSIPITTAKQPIQPGDVIFLARSNIVLKFIVRQAGDQKG